MLDSEWGKDFAEKEVILRWDMDKRNSMVCEGDPKPFSI